MTKKVIAILSLFMGLVGYSQENTASPYSAFGIGEVRFRGTEAEKAMGSLAITGDSITVNLLNPASYSHLKLTNFSIGGTSTFSNLKNNINSESAKRTGIDYLNVGIPMGKFGATLGLMPYSSVGYKISNTATENDLERTKRFSGDGYINKVYLGGAYSFNKNLSLGLNFEYNFGNIENKIVESITNVQLATRELNESRINGISVKAGFLYNRKLTEKLDFYSGITYQPKAKLNAENNRTLSTITFSNNGNELVADQGNTFTTKSKLIIPSRFSFGGGIGERNKWLLGTDITLLNSKEQTNRLDNTLSEYKNGQTYAIGGYYIPDYDSFTNYFKRVAYRAGFRYEKTGLIVNSEDINNYGMNFGFGFPLGTSKLDLGLEFGKRGTTNSNLIQENYFNLSIGLSISDKWFRKVLID